MLKPAAILFRTSFEPTVHGEWLANHPGPDEEPIWSEKEADAFFFDDYFDAGKFAKDLRKRIGGHLIVPIVRPQRHETPEREHLFFNGEDHEIVAARTRRLRSHHPTGRMAHLVDGELAK